MQQCATVSRSPWGFPGQLLSGCLLLGMWWASSQAQVPTAITPDGTLGTAVTQMGTIYTITGGTRPGQGPNLFHSFDRFSVGTNDIARFSGPSGIANILSRVTGGQPSLIDGRLYSTIPGANLYLLNPRGVLFGPNASLDITGSFHVSTADFLRFADGAIFSAHLSEKSTLTMAPPSAFGFLSQNPAGIALQGSTLQVLPGEGISVVGGDIEIVRGKLVAPSGRVQIASVASPGEATFSLPELTPTLQVDSFLRLGRVDLSQGALIDASGAEPQGSGGPGGTVLIRSGRLMVERSSIFADTKGPVHGAKLGMDIQIAEEFLQTSESFITTDGLGTGNAGDIQITADSLRMENTAVIGSRVFNGDAGEVRVNAVRVSLTGGSQISGSTSGLGRGGNVTVRATEAVRLAGTNPVTGIQSGIAAQARGTGARAGDAGTVTVSAPQVSLIDGARIGGSTLGPGRGGNVMIQAAEAVQLAGPSGIASNTLGTGAGGTVTVSAPQVSLTNGAAITGSTLGPGAGGIVRVEAAHVSLTNGATITSNTLGPGASGSVTVRATEAVTVAGTNPVNGAPSGIAAQAQGTSAGAGAAGPVTVKAATVAVTNGAVISSTTVGPGAGGIVRVEAAHVSLTNGATITSNTLGPGASGSVTVRATEAVTVAGTNPVNGAPSGIAAQAQGTSAGAGAAGPVTVEAATVAVTNGAVISSTTVGPGAGGSVTIQAAEAVQLAGPSGIASNTLGTGAGGTVTVSAPQVSLTNGAAITGSTLGPGAGGIVRVEAAHVSLTNGATITSNTLGPGASGSVTVRATEAVTVAGTNPVNGAPSGIAAQAQGTGAGAGAAGPVTLEAARVMVTDGAAISSTTLGPGAGGSVTVRATDTVALSGQTSGLFAETGGSGTGGDIALHAPQIYLTDGAAISAASLGMGNAGNITIGASDTFRSRHSTVSTATRQADGGNITLQAASLVQLRDSQLTTTVQGGEGRGGNVTIDPRFVLLERSQIRANAAGGPGGNVRISAGVFLADPASRITASSARNVPGEINIQAAITTLNGLVPPLSPDFASATALLYDLCAARLREGTVSTFVVRERASLPATYDSMLPTRLYEPQGHQGPPDWAGPSLRLMTTFPTSLPGAATPFVPLGLDQPCPRP